MSNTPESMLSCSNLLFLISAFPLFKFITTLIYQIFKYFLPFPDLLKRYCRSDIQSWAVVTGATDGIGLGFCQILAQIGFNIVLISRNPEKLRVTIDELKKFRPPNSRAEFRSIPFNFKDSSDRDSFMSLMAQIEVLDIGLFVNNVGTADNKFYHQFSYEQIVDTINVNCVGMAALSSQILGLMRRRTHKSAMINLSSYMQESPLPFFSLYSATKGFIKNLSEGLVYEYPQIDILCIKPWFVQTKLSQVKKGFTIPDRRECASESLKQLNFESESYGYISHRIIGSIKKNLVPDFLYRLGLKYFSKPVMKIVFKDLKVD